jgi:tRNA pseudouridine32 synthase/23S rRNA pseudouridine746 synthase
VLDIFEEAHNRVPPTGAGECAAPKMLQFAYSNNLKPITMAEFWWGVSDKSEVRKHGQFYPACRGKCEPILNHMLKGLAIDPNPIMAKLAEAKEIEILFEDAHMLVINKPANLLSIPGKEIEDSVLSRMRIQYPEATGPLVVHRLDMSTSGLLLIAKSKDAHKALQQQFEDRTIRKRYTALLDGALNGKKGAIELPLRVDFHDRPRQLVCFEHGKSAMTNWELVGIEKKGTRVHFYPITGRTHQLRMHAAHHLGLNAPIVGDELYGSHGDRLHLHADQITFMHPETGQEMTITSLVPF